MGADSLKRVTRDPQLDGALGALDQALWGSREGEYLPSSVRGTHDKANTIAFIKKVRGNAQLNRMLGEWQRGGRQDAVPGIRPAPLIVENPMMGPSSYHMALRPGGDGPQVEFYEQLLTGPGTSAVATSEDVFATYVDAGRLRILLDQAVAAIGNR